MNWKETILENLIPEKTGDLKLKIHNEYIENIDPTLCSSFFFLK